MTVRSIVLAWLASLLCTQACVAATFNVTTTADTGAGSLREAITSANGGSGTNTIAFAIPAATDSGCVAATGVCTISPASALPDIDTPMLIDGYTQTGAAANTNSVESRLGLNGALKIELRGTSVSSVLSIDSPDVIVRGLVINDINSYGVNVHLLSGGGVTIEGNYVGTDVSGTSAIAHSSLAIGVYAGSTGTILIGGITPTSRNLLSGGYEAVFSYNSIAPTIQGNLIGTDASGTLPLSASSIGLYLNPVAVGVVIGGAQAGAGNLIFNDPGTSIYLSGGTGNLIQGNLVGTGVTGTNVIPHSSGVFIVNATDSLIGGLTAAARNVISGGSGIELSTVAGVTGTGNNRIQGNYIGTDISGTLDRGNTGIGIFLGSAGTIVGGTAAGEANIIAFTKSSGGANSGIGVLIGGETGQSILGNSIYANAAIGIDLASGGSADGVTPNDTGDADTGANNLQNYPVLTSAAIAAGNATISGTINTNAASTLRLEFFANAVCSPSGNGEGQTFIGATNVTTNASGSASFGPLSFAVPSGQTIITATATSASGDTSEFSHCQIAGSGLASTTTTVTSSLDPSVLGQTVTFTARVAGSSPGGSVQFKDGTANLGAPVILSASAGALTTAALSAGTHAITAVYSGDAGNAPSTSAVLSQVVTSTALTPTATTISSSNNPSTVGAAVTLSAVVTFVAAEAIFPGDAVASVSAAAAPSGSVQFRDGGVPLGSAVGLAGSSASLTTSALSAGSHSITAVYSGDAVNAPSTSPVLLQIVNAVVVTPPSTTLEPAPMLSDGILIALTLVFVALGAGRVRRATRSHSSRR